MNLSVRKIKTFRGTEGYGFNAELCADGKPVAFVLGAKWNTRFDERGG